MSRRFDLIVFDWDGTLLDSTGAIVHAIQAACTDLGLEPPGERTARAVIGLGLQDALGTAVPQLDRRDYGRLAERYRHHYLSRDHELRLYPGASALLDRLRSGGYSLGIATGKSRLGLERALALSGLGTRFTATRCADECDPKPHPAMLLELMAATAAAPARTLMVGDTTHDLRMARNAAVPAVAVTFGAHPREQLAKERPLECVDSIEALGRWIALHG